MLFVIDIGNTHTVGGIFERDTIARQWRIKTDPMMTADELGIQYHNLFHISGVDISSIEAIVISSVVPQLDSAYFACCRLLFKNLETNKLIRVTIENVADLLEVKLPNPAEVGADRLVNGIAACQKYQGGSIIIDFGTAITFDCISARREYLGGLILPGLNVSLQALTRKAAKLPQIDISIPPPSVVGTSTINAMKSGVLYGYGAMVEGLIGQVKKEMADMGCSVSAVVATGGFASIIKPYAPSVQYVEPNLTLEGLYIINQHLSQK